MGAGTYNVYAMWAASANRAEQVPIDIHCAGGDATVTVNQKTDGGVWHLLGTYSFGGDSSGSVTIRTDGTSGYVVADAVKFEPVP